MLKFEFKKSKYPLIPISFFLAIIFSLASFIYIPIVFPSDFKTNDYFSLKKPVFFSLETKKTLDYGVAICYDDYCEEVTEDLEKSLLSHKHLYKNLHRGQKIQNVYLIYATSLKNFLNDIEGVDLNLGLKTRKFSSSDLKKLENKKVKIEFNSKVNDYNALLLSNEGNMVDFKYNLKEYLKFLRDNFKLFIGSILCLIFVAIIYIFKKEEIKSFLNKNKGE